MPHAKAYGSKPTKSAGKATHKLGTKTASKAAVKKATPRKRGY